MKRTIVALATPAGISSIAVIRISGEQSFEILDKVFNGKIKIRDSKTHTIHYGKIIFENELIDDVTVSIFKAPNSYTGEDVAEISCHGNMLIVNQIINTLITNGVVDALPGEFTKIAFLNGRIDLSQAEAIADIIHSQSKPGIITSERQFAGNFKSRIQEIRTKLLNIASILELELDFSEEEIELIDKHTLHLLITNTIDFANKLAASYQSSQILRSGYYIAITGYPNSGKSTLFNKLLQKNRAIVSHIPGTTRDYIEESFYINNIPIKIIDTAGIRDTDDEIEIEGIKMADSVLSQANMILVLNDLSISQLNSDSLYKQLSDRYSAAETILIQNKIDKTNIEIKKNEDIIYISAKMEIGLDQIRELIISRTQNNIDTVNDVLVNQRQYFIFNEISNLLQNALQSSLNNYPNEIIAIDVKQAAMKLGELTGDNWNEEVLNNIFSRFCIGK